MFEKNKMIILLILLLISTIILAVFVYNNYYKTGEMNNTTQVVNKNIANNINNVADNNTVNINTGEQKNSNQEDIVVDNATSEGESGNTEGESSNVSQVQLSTGEQKRAGDAKGLADLAKKVYKSNAMSFEKVCSDPEVRTKVSEINGQCFSSPNGYAITFKLSQGGYYCVDYSFDGVVPGNNMPVSSTDLFCNN